MANEVKRYNNWIASGRKPAAGMSAEDQALLEYLNANKEFVGGGAPVYESGAPLSLEQLEAYDQLGPSAVEGIETDPRYREYEMEALRQLEEQSQKGFTARDEADLSRVQQQANRANRGRQGSIQQNMQARGLGGSGLEFAMAQQAAQDATEMEALAGLEKNAQMMERKQSAAQRLGSLGSELQGRDFAQAERKAQAQDAITRFNTANSIQRQQANNQITNEAAQQNWSRNNTTGDRNTAAGYDFRKDSLGVQQAGAQMQYNKATDDYNRAQLKKQQKKARNAGVGSALGGIAGGAAGAYFGGPAGAAAGYSAGSALGGSVGNFAQGGRIPGVAPFPGDDPRNDLYTANVSAGERVLPRSVADDPEAAADFVAADVAANDPFASIKNERVREYMRQKHSAQQDLDSAQKAQDMFGYANLAGKALTEFGNSQKQDVALKNRMQDLGKAPEVAAANRAQWDSSMLDKLGQNGVDRAKGKISQLGADFNEGVMLSKFDRAEAIAAAANDPSSQESINAREYLKQIAPGVADSLRGFERLTAEQVQKSAPGLFDKYKVDVSEKNASNRLNAQIAAEERRYARDQDKQEKKELDQKHKRSVDIRKELSSNPAYKNLQETDARLAQVDELMKNPSGVKDEAILVMYQKALDPGSVVREGEFARTAAGQSLIGRVDNIIQQHGKGTRMTPELRAEVLNTMKALRDGNRAYMQRAIAPYEREIRDYNLDRSIILGSDEAGPAAAPQKKMMHGGDLP